MARFEGIMRSRYITIDHALITALVERWCPETHTFHLPVGEATMTLQYVEVLWGIRVDGPPLTGVETSLATCDWISMCIELLGFAPPPSAIVGTRLKVRYVAEYLDSYFSADAPDEVCRQRARCYLLILIGGLLFSDKSGNRVSLRLLPFLRDIETMGQYSWGSAILAYLYRSLCDATSPAALMISGPLVLLQIWAWEHLPTMRQDLVNPIDAQYGPRAVRWDVQFDLHRAPRHVVAMFRDQLCGIQHDQFVWQQYNEDLLAVLPGYCSAGRRIWTSVAYLIAWEVVEAHLPHRVLRQFGLRQPIPDNRLMDGQRMLHSIGRRGRSNNDWQVAHQAYITAWAARHDTIETDFPHHSYDDHTDEYMEWYTMRTVIHICNLRTQPPIVAGYQGDASTADYLMDVICRLHHVSIDSMASTNPQCVEHWAYVRDVTASLMNAVGEGRRLQSRPLSVPDHFSPSGTDPSCVQRLSRHVRGGRRVGGRRRRRPVSPNIDINTVPVTHDEAGPSTQVGDDTSPHGHRGYNDAHFPLQTPPVQPVYESSMQHEVMHSPTAYRPVFSITPIHYSMFDSPFTMLEGTSTAPDITAQLQSQFNPFDDPLPQPRRSRKVPIPRACGTHGRLGCSGHCPNRT